MMASSIDMALMDGTWAEVAYHNRAGANDDTCQTQMAQSEQVTTMVSDRSSLAVREAVDREEPCSMRVAALEEDNSLKEASGMGSMLLRKLLDLFYFLHLV